MISMFRAIFVYDFISGEKYTLMRFPLMKKIEVAYTISRKFFKQSASINTRHLISIRLQRILLIILISFISRDHRARKHSNIVLRRVARREIAQTGCCIVNRQQEVLLHYEAACLINNV